MKQGTVLIVLTLWCCCLPACRSERRVHADSEPSPTETYRPLQSASARLAQPIQGELNRVDPKNNTLVLRMENGVEQTFFFNDQTKVIGAPPAVAREKTPVTSQVAALIGRDGSEIKVQWTGEGADKTATSVDVLQLTAVKKTARRR